MGFGHLGAGAVASGAQSYGPLPWVAGLFYATPGVTGTATTVEGNATAYPLWVPPAAEIDQLLCEVVTTPGSAGAVIRMGVYDDDGTGYPGDLLVDGGTVAAESTGVKSVTLGSVLALPSPLVWLVGVVQGEAATRPTVRTITSGSYPVHSANSTRVMDTSLGHVTGGSESGALPSTFPTGFNPSTTARTKVAVRAA